MRPLVLAAVVNPCSPFVIDIDEPVDWEVPVPLDALSDDFTSCAPASFVPLVRPAVDCAAGDAALVGTDRFATVEAAVESADDGATVFVCPGTHRATIRLTQRRLAVASASGDPADTRLSGGYESPLVVADRSVLTLSAITLRHGRTSLGGGAVRATNSALRLAGVRLDDNRARSGGAVSGSGTSVLVQASAFVANQAGDDGGGVALLDGCAEVQFTAFDDNFAGGQGGGLSAIRSTVSASSVTYLRNRALTQGGAMQVEGPLEVLGATFTDNAANERGGAIQASTDAVSIEDTTFSGNGATDAGGALNTTESTEVWLRGGVFTDNTAQAGGAVDVDAARFFLEGGSFEGPPTLRVAPLRATRPNGTVQGWAVGFPDRDRDHVDTPCGSFVLGLDAAFTCDDGVWSVP